MPRPIVEEQPEIQIADADKGCLVKMNNGERCARPIYSAPAGVDKIPICLMHSHDTKKDDTAFQLEFESILREAGEGTADFTEFVFPMASYLGQKFKQLCIFRQATFTQYANFGLAT